MSGEDAKRHWDDGRGWSSFLDKVLLECPYCGGCAAIESVRTDAGTVRRFACSACGRHGDYRSPIMLGVASSTQVLPDGTSARLWLTTPCCGEELWAFNESHIAFLEELIGAQLRERSKSEHGAWSNGSMASRLPRWMKAAKNRDAVLKALAKLRKHLPDRG